MILAVLVAGPAGAAERIGEAVHVRDWANVKPAGESSSSALYIDDPVHFRDTVSTVREGGLHLNLMDGSEVRLGSECEVVLDEFVYDPGDPSAGRSAARVGKGIARFITGSIRQNFRVRTPTAVIGVRGTDFSVWVEEDENGRTTIWVNEGEITVTPTAAGAAEAVVTQDETVLVEPGGTEVQRDAIRPSGDPGIGSPLRRGRR